MTEPMHFPRNPAQGGTSELQACLSIGKRIAGGRNGALAHPQFFVLVGVQAEGIRIIRLGGIIVF